MGCLAKEACRDDLDWQQRSLTIAVLQDVKKADIGKRIEHWLEQHKEMYSRWQNMLANLRRLSTVSFIMFSVAVRELMDLAQVNVHLLKANNKSAAQAETKAKAKAEATTKAHKRKKADVKTERTSKPDSKAASDA